MAAAETRNAKRVGTYEAMFLFPASASAEVDGSIKTARGFIERHGGKVIVIKKWDERKLAYELKRNKRGLYVIAYFTAPTSAVAPIERDVRLSEDIIRVLITDASHLNEDEMNKVEPQPIIPREPAGFGEGGGWGGGGGGWGGGGGGRGGRGGGDRGDRSDRPERPSRAPAAAEGEPASKE
jgi:small subunit ribosomal protein S6